MIILRQKEFGIIRKLLKKSADKNDFDALDLTEKRLFNKRIRNIGIEKKIIEDNKNIGYVSSKPPGRMSPSSRPPTAEKEVADKVRAELSNPDNNFTEDELMLLGLILLCADHDIHRIFWDRCDGLEELAHEFGHVKLHKGKSIIDKFIQKGADFSGKWKKLPPGVINAVLDVIASVFKVGEEVCASNKGYELLKSYNLSKEELDLARRNMSEAIEVYKLQGRASWKRKLINSKIPQWLL